VIVADGIHGPTALYSDGTVEHLDLDEGQPPLLQGDVNFEEVKGGFEVWISQRLVVHYGAMIDEFLVRLLDHPRSSPSETTCSVSFRPRRPGRGSTGRRDGLVGIGGP